MVVGRVMVVGGVDTAELSTNSPWRGLVPSSWGPAWGPSWRNAPRGSQVERTGPRRTSAGRPGSYLRIFRGMEVS